MNLIHLQCAESVLVPTAAKEEDVYFVGNAPCGHLVENHPDPKSKAPVTFKVTFIKLCHVCYGGGPHLYVNYILHALHLVFCIQFLEILLLIALLLWIRGFSSDHNCSGKFDTKLGIIRTTLG